MKIIETNFSWAQPLSPRKKTDKIVLHHAAAVSASVTDVHRWHLERQWAGIGYHFYVRKDGAVYRGRPELMIGAHTRGCNSASLGICFEGNFETEKMPEVQRAAGEALLAELELRFGKLPLFLHKQLTATLCPGKNFPDFSEKAKENPKPEAAAEAPDKWAAEACEWAVGVGLVAGDGSGNYAWRTAVTKQELAVLFSKFHSIEK
ncbi:MAG: peptidoglycan recognition protein family protein [Oscillospiraceae bacterium]|jgi:hypothetical protein|nr:peptidoglycan recognition protein family protein [Oscillospiraceae bacterium]